MAREFARTDRIADAIQRILATTIAQEVRDPRVGMVNINNVAVSRDMAYAKIYVTFVGRDNETECNQAANALNHAAGFLRSTVAKELDIRVTPKLQFYYDKTSVHGQQLSNLIDKAIAEDLSHHTD
ncbi:ribosome-binding factor A [Candidatus Endobugula sertula]|uniref:Ribosome-binding factor A n=1 Tax=Candidatus Endobugula sertula TaxID=62101 RepID=A0A1D2QML0_9GAMM|nr:ribosome-binding factor A [Candidatus Endobugula sertula]